MIQPTPRRESASTAKLPATSTGSTLSDVLMVPIQIAIACVYLLVGLSIRIWPPAQPMDGIDPENTDYDRDKRRYARGGSVTILYWVLASIANFMLSLSIGIAALIAIGSVPGLLALISTHLASMGDK